MPVLRDPDFSNSKALLCPACVKPMRLAESRPSQHYANLAERLYRCDCGEMADCIARKK